MNLKKKHIVCLGGGNAMPKAVLVGLKNCPVKISVICAMLDSGGSTGRLRKDYKICPGDMRRAFIALASTSHIMEDLFNFRFSNGELKGHNFANLLITALELSTNSHEMTVKTINELLNVNHEVLPATLDDSDVCAKLENGKIICGETNIDEPKHDGNLKIKEVFLKPEANAYPKSLKAIEKADIITIGPGDLYSSLAQILLTKGMSQAICGSKAKKVFICNIMTKFGETNNFSVKDFTNEIEKYLKCKLDYVFYNTAIPEKNRVKKYVQKHKELLELVKLDDNLDKCKFIGKDLILSEGPIDHDTNKIAKILCKL